MNFILILKPHIRVHNYYISFIRLYLLCFRSLAFRGARMLSSRTLRVVQQRGYADEMAFTFAAANKTFYQGANIRQVDVPSFSGSFGILPKHVPTLAVIKPGVVTVYEADGKVQKVFVSSGTITVNDDSSVQVNLHIHFLLQVYYKLNYFRFLLKKHTHLMLLMSMLPVKYSQNHKVNWHKLQMKGRRLKLLLLLKLQRHWLKQQKLETKKCGFKYFQ